MANLAGPPGQSLGQMQAEGILRGVDAVDAAIALQDGRNANPGTQPQLQAQQADPAALAVRWESLQQRHPEWLADFWAECRALYAGGQRLLGDKAVLCRLFPKTPHEPNDLYGSRLERAHYYPYAGTIVDSLLAGLDGDPLHVAFGTINDEGELEEAAGSEWWKSFVEDVSDERDDDEADDDDDQDARGMSLHHFLVEVLREAMQTRHTWIRCDLSAPAPEADAPIDSALAAEKARIRDPYLCLVPAECVVDWEYDDAGEQLLWALTLEKKRPRASLAARRGNFEIHCFTLWTQTDWVYYEQVVDLKNPPAKSHVVMPKQNGTHPFGRVPLHRVVLPDGLHAMGKLHSLAREHFNKRCAMSWAEYKALFPIRFEFQDDSDPGGAVTPAAEDPNRATTQLNAQGYTQIRRGKDRVEYVGPDVAPFKESRESCNDAMREMHRVMFSMALSANMDKQALGRSGDSKEQDQHSTQVLLVSLGQLLRRIGRSVLGLASKGRGEPLPASIMSGLEEFDTVGLSSIIAEAVQVFTGDIPLGHSKTAYTLYSTKVLRQLVGDNATDAQIAEIRKEVADSVSAEELLRQAMAAVPPAGGKTDDPGDDDEEDPNADPEDPDDREPPEKPGSGRFKSKPMKRR